MAYKRLLFYGGAFDPPHEGHRKLLEAAIDATDPDITLIVPTGVSPHKQNSRTSFEHRMQMSRLAFGDLDGVRVSNTDVHRGKSYSIRTIKRLHKKYPEAQIYMLIGADMLLSFKRWYRYKRIMSRVILVAGCRNASDEERLREAAGSLEKEGAKVILLSFSSFDASSTEIRKVGAVEAQRKGMISERVAEYILGRNLYT